MRVYLNTSLLVRAVAGDEAARRFLEECCKRHKCVVSSVHWREGWRRETREAVQRLLGDLSVRVVEVELLEVEDEAWRLLRLRGWSASRLLDLMHVLAAVRLGCDAVAAVDRFIRARCREYNLLYVNHYTGCPG